MNQIFRTLQSVSGRCAYTSAELTVTEFPAEQGFYGTDDDVYTEGGAGGGEWGGGGKDEYGPEIPTIGGV